MSKLNQDFEPPVVVASRWVHQITSIALEMALPAGAGYWLDKKWKCSPYLLLVGAGFGLIAAALSFAQMVKKMTPPGPPSITQERQSPLVMCDFERTVPPQGKEAD